MSPEPSTWVVVTGAAGAIGSATARRFHDVGLCVLGLDLSSDVRTVLDSDRYLGKTVDVRDEQGVSEALAEARSLGSLAHVVGIAGGALPSEPHTQHDPAGLDPAEFRESVELNLTSQFVVLRAALPWLRDAPDRDRSITLTSSWNALTGCGMPAYSAAKAGLIGMMHALTGPLGSEGIRINVIAPGTVRTPRTERIWGRVEGHFERLEAGTALGRLTRPAQVAEVIVATATSLTAVTGQTLVVDSGQSVKR